MGILRLWETLGRFIEETARMHFMLEGAAALITAIFVVLGWFPSPRLLRRVLFHGQRLSYPWAFKELLECLVTLWRIGPTHLFRPQSVRHGVRVWVEYEIFHQHHGAELPGFAPWRPKWWTVRVRRRRRESEADSQRAEAVRRFIETGQTSIKVDTCFAFRHEDTADAIERYLKAFADDERVFISTLVVKTAYVAPLRLLSGLLAHFKQDWVPVIDDFGAILARLDHPIGTSELRAIQAFIFDCWLLWGYRFLRDDGAAVATALGFTLTAPGVHTAIVGTTRPARWQENAVLLERGALPKKEFDGIRARWRAVAESSWEGQV